MPLPTLGLTKLPVNADDAVKLKLTMSPEIGRPSVDEPPADSAVSSDAVPVSVAEVVPS